MILVSSDMISASPALPRTIYRHPAAKAKSFASERSSGTGFLDVLTMVIELLTL
jgi:hypothetical protein